jgi:hypothetical protein
MTTLQNTTCGLSKSHEMGRAVAKALKQATLLSDLDSMVVFSLHSSIAQDEQYNITFESWWSYCGKESLVLELFISRNSPLYLCSKCSLSKIYLCRTPGHSTPDDLAQDGSSPRGRLAPAQCRVADDILHTENESPFAGCQRGRLYAKPPKSRP